MRVRLLSDVRFNGKSVRAGEEYEAKKGGSISPGWFKLYDDSGASLFFVGPHECVVVEENVDLVNRPPHYRYGNFEVIDILDEAFPDDPHLWAAGKYLLRAKRKGNEKQDLEKAIFFIKRRLNCLK